MFGGFKHIHTGRELDLMLDGKKPLSVFSDGVSVLPNEEIIPEKLFHEYVISGVLVREEFCYKSRHQERTGEYPIIKCVLFALPAEVWRIEAMKLLRTEFNRTGEWNETCERIEGKLLGYTDEENEIWVNRVKDVHSEI